VRVLGEDGQEKMETINDMLLSMDGAVPVNDLKLGKYDVDVSVGPAYSAKREETRAGLEEFFRGFPEARAALGDLYADTLEWKHADRAAERLRKMLPPALAEEPEEMTPEQMQAKQMQAVQAQQQAQMQAQAMEIERRKAEAEAVEAEADAVKAQAEAEKAQIEVAGLKGDIKALVESSVEQAVAAVMTRPAMI
jgi:hypothetical protein